MRYPLPHYRIGDPVFDEELGVGIIKKIYYDDSDYEGIVYYIWWLSSDDHSFEYPEDLLSIGQKLKGDGHDL